MGGDDQPRGDAPASGADLPGAADLPTGGRVLVVRLSALGDVLFALETVASLHAARPDVRIDFLVEDRWAGVLADHPHLDTVHTLPRRGRLGWLAAAWRLRRQRYDVVLDLHGILKSAVPVRLTRARRRLGPAAPAAREGAWRLYDEAVAMPTPLPHRADRGLTMLRALGLPGAPAAPALALPDDGESFWDGPRRPRVVLHPGTSAFAAFKRWPAERHGRLAARLLGSGVDVAVAHGPDEAALADAVLTLAPGARRLDGGAVGLLGYAARAAAADVVVAGDTGPLHLAAAAGTRVVALFGPKDPELYGPRGPWRADAPTHALVFHDVPCRPCRRRTCASPQCVLGVDEATVESRVRAMLAEAEA